jgi:hypothetical protein
LHNSENISIFANEYRLLSSIGRTDIVNETVQEINNQEEILVDSKVEETQEEKKELTPDNNLTDDYSSTPNIDIIKYLKNQINKIITY